MSRFVFAVQIVSGHARRGNERVQVPPDVYLVGTQNADHYLIRTRGLWGAWGWVPKTECTAVAYCLVEPTYPGAVFPRRPASLPRPFELHRGPAPLFDRIPHERVAEASIAHMKHAVGPDPINHILVIGGINVRALELIRDIIGNGEGGPLTVSVVLPPNLVAEFGDYPDVPGVTYDILDAPLADVVSTRERARRWNSFVGIRLIVVAIEQSRVPAMEAISLASSRATEASVVALFPGELRRFEASPRQREYFDLGTPAMVEGLLDNWRHHCPDLRCTSFVVAESVARTSAVVSDPAPPPDPVDVWDEDEIEDFHENFLRVSSVWVYRAFESDRPFLASVPVPHAEDQGHSSHEPPHRGYVRGSLLAVTRRAGIVLVTHVARRLAPDTHKQMPPIEDALDRPLVRAFPLQMMNAWGPWQLGDNNGFLHWVTGDPIMRDESEPDVPVMRLRDFVRMNDRQVWAAFPRVRDAYTSSSEYTRAVGVPQLPGSVQTIENVVFPDSQEMDITMHDWGLVVRYVGGPTRLIGAPNITGWRARDSVVDGVAAFLDGSWVGDIHNGLHGVWQAFDRTMGYTASVGVAYAAADISLGVADAMNPSHPHDGTAIGHASAWWIHGWNGVLRQVLWTAGDAIHTILRAEVQASTPYWQSRTAYYIRGFNIAMGFGV